MAVKCAVCKQQIEEGAVTFRGKNYHPACLEKAKSAARAKNARASAAVGDAGLNTLSNYICEKMEMSELSPSLRGQIKTLKNDGLSYEDMLLALHYFYEACGREPIKNSIGIIPYVVDDAKAFAAMIAEADEHNQSVATKNSNVIIHVDPRRWDTHPDYRMEDL